MTATTPNHSGASFSTPEYPALPKHTKCIRVVDILPGMGNQSEGMCLEIFPEPVNLVAENFSPCYEALSYVWGDEGNPVSINLKSLGKVGTLKVTKNLFEALLHLRHESKARTMWIDAICIRQKDNEEKEHQVTLMGDVYRKATSVVAWLGPATDDSDRALRAIEANGSHDSLGYEYGILPASNDQDTQAICALLSRPWFERLWVRQEIALGTEHGRAATLQCGTARASWRALDRTLREKWWMWEAAYVRGWLRHFDRLTFVLAMCEATRSGYALCDVQKATKGAKCKDPRDKIYGIIQICRDLLDLNIKPDYVRSYQEVYRNVTREYISQFKRLDILATCFFVDREDNIQLPSWVPDYQSYDSRDDIPEWPWPVLDSYFAVQDITSNQALGDPLLHLRGVTIGSIKHVWGLFGDGGYMTLRHTMFKMWRDGLRPMQSHGQMMYPDEASLIEAFCRTLFLGHVHDMMKCMGNVQNVEHFFSKVRTELEGRDSGGRQVLTPFLMVPNVIRHTRRNFFITDTGKMGTGPLTIQHGDKVVALLGSGVPFIITKSCGAEPGIDGDHHYRIRGACYVDRCMAQEPFLGQLPGPTCTDDVHSQFCYDHKGQNRKEWPDPRLEEFKSRMGGDHNEGIDGTNPTRLMPTTPEQWRRFGVDLEEFTIM